MRPITDWEITEMMTHYGGGFASALAEAARRADTDNLLRLKAAFPELWAEYRQLAEVKVNGPETHKLRRG